MNSSIFDGMTDAMKEFLISSYFGDINDENLTRTCVERAYRDLARRAPYGFSVSKLENMKKKNNHEKEEAEEFEKEKEKFKAKMTEDIIDLIEKKCMPREIIEKIVAVAATFNIWEDRKAFGYGLCQKWVNMSLKYLWLFDKCPLDAASLDAPIDSYIIHAALSDKTDEQPYGLAIASANLKRDTSWSTMEKALYIEIQDKIDEALGKSDLNMSKIQWESRAWIEQAKFEA